MKKFENSTSKNNKISITQPLWAQSHNCCSSIPKIIQKRQKRDRRIFSFKHIIKNFDSVPKNNWNFIWMFGSSITGCWFIRIFRLCFTSWKIISELDIKYKREIRQFLGKCFCACITVEIKIYWYLGADISFRKSNF
jgi:hypothetical protein